MQPRENILFFCFDRRQASKSLLLLDCLGLKLGLRLVHGLRLRLRLRLGLRLGLVHGQGQRQGQRQRRGRLRRAKKGRKLRVQAHSHPQTAFSPRLLPCAPLSLFFFSLVPCLLRASRVALSPGDLPLREKGLLPAGREGLVGHLVRHNPVPLVARGSPPQPPVLVLPC